MVYQTVQNPSDTHVYVKIEQCLIAFLYSSAKLLFTHDVAFGIKPGGFKTVTHFVSARHA